MLEDVRWIEVEERIELLPVGVAWLHSLILIVVESWDEHAVALHQILILHIGILEVRKGGFIWLEEINRRYILLAKSNIIAFAFD